MTRKTCSGKDQRWWYAEGKWEKWPLIGKHECSLPSLFCASAFSNAFHDNKHALWSYVGAWRLSVSRVSSCHHANDFHWHAWFRAVNQIRLWHMDAAEPRLFLPQGSACSVRRAAQVPRLPLICKAWSIPRNRTKVRQESHFHTDAATLTNSPASWAEN